MDTEICSLFGRTSRENVTHEVNIDVYKDKDKDEREGIKSKQKIRSQSFLPGSHRFMASSETNSIRKI